MQEQSPKSLHLENVIPKSDKIRQLELQTLQAALRLAWNSSTCTPSDASNWTRDNPALGQCAVTSLLVNEVFGGKIVKDIDNNHYWNILDDGSEVDLTREQFPMETIIKAKEERTKDSMLNSDRSITAKTKERYQLLIKKLISIFVENF